MTNKLAFACTLLALTLSACRNEEHRNTIPHSSLPSNLCHHVPQAFNSPTSPGSSIIQIGANPQNPLDSVTVSLCKLSDCGASYPALTCAQAQPGQPCHIIAPSIYDVVQNPLVTYGDHTVTFAGVQEAGYDGWAITTYICQ